MAKLSSAIQIQLENERGYRFGWCLFSGTESVHVIVRNSVKDKLNKIVSMDLFSFGGVYCLLAHLKIDYFNQFSSKIDGLSTVVNLIFYLFSYHFILMFCGSGSVTTDDNSMSNY